MTEKIEGITYEQIPQIRCPVCTTKLDIVDGEPIPVNIPTVDSMNKLTPREKQILVLVAKGKSNKDIAKLLFISKRTVEIHRANIMRKINCRPQIDQLINWAKIHGID